MSDANVRAISIILWNHSVNMGELSEREEFNQEEEQRQEFWLCYLLCTWTWACLGFRLQLYPMTEREDLPPSRFMWSLVLAGCRLETLVLCHVGPSRGHSQHSHRLSQSERVSKKCSWQKPSVLYSNLKQWHLITFVKCYSLEISQ
jgi:hypothetical protein